MALVLNSPVAAGMLVNVGSGHFPGFPACEDAGVFLADAIAGDLEYLAADEGGLAGVREIDAFCAGDPAGPSFYPAAAVFLCDMVRGLGEQRENFLEYCSLQGWLVSLDGHQVVPSGFPADVFR